MDHIAGAMGDWVVVERPMCGGDGDCCIQGHDVCIRAASQLNKMFALLGLR
jgi:hypothetical protein